jgi:hypothetical protein
MEISIMKIWKHCTFVGILVVIIFVFALSCSGGNRLSGTWVCERGWFVPYTFSGRNWREGTGNDSGWHGTYSISGNRIEFVGVEGWIEVYSFSRTQNTITIDGRRYIRR